METVEVSETIAVNWKLKALFLWQVSGRCYNVRLPPLRRNDLISVVDTGKLVHLVF